MVFGTFDMIHAGHRHMLAEARQWGDELTVVIGRDRSVVRLKGRSAHHNERERLTAMQESGLADRVILGHEYDRLLVIEQERPDVVALGYDQQVPEQFRERLPTGTRVVRLQAFQPEIYKTSKLLSGKF